MTSGTSSLSTTAPAARAPTKGMVIIAACGAALIALRADTPAITVVGVLLLAAPLLSGFLAAPTIALDAVLVSCTVAGELVAATPINVGFRLYPLDLLLIPAVVAGVAQAADRPAAAPLTRAWLVTIGLGLVGVAALVHGLWSHNPLLDALGTFRRMLVYPVVSFWIFTVFLRQRDALSRLRRLLLWSAVLLCLLAVYRVVAGRGYAAEVFTGVGNVTRYLSFTEVLGVIYGALLALTMSALAGDARGRWLAGVGFAAFTLAVVASNYRTAWVAYAGGMVLAGTLITLRTPRTAWRLLPLGLVAVTTIVVVMLATPLGPLIEQKFSTANLVATGSWRLASWLKAFSVFRDHPWFGVGLGYQHQFFRPSADWQSTVLNQGNTIHNDFLWLLVNTGLIGLTILLVTWLVVVRRGLRAARRAGGREKEVMTIASLAQLAVVGLTASFQPTISLGATGVTLGLIAAILANPPAESIDDSAVPTPQ
ncbi:MAG: O-antigen ligase family protein [Chloroflexi bacterium]|nr:MAG: O-antigen ligase family protein [Chloroflexota bacterium]